MATDVAKLVAAGVAIAGKVGGVRLTFHYHFRVAMAWQKRENGTPPEI